MAEKGKPDMEPKGIPEMKSPGSPAAPFFTVTYNGKDYNVESNMGDGWRWHLMRLAKELKELL